MIVNENGLRGKSLLYMILDLRVVNSAKEEDQGQELNRYGKGRLSLVLHVIDLEFLSHKMRNAIQMVRE